MIRDYRYGSKVLRFVKSSCLHILLLENSLVLEYLTAQGDIPSEPIAFLMELDNPKGAEIVKKICED